MSESITRLKFPRKPHTPGKGSKRRPENLRAFESNYEAINWGIDKARIGDEPHQPTIKARIQPVKRRLGKS